MLINIEDNKRCFKACDNYAIKNGLCTCVNSSTIDIKESQIITSISDITLLKKVNIIIENLKSEEDKQILNLLSFRYESLSELYDELKKDINK